MGGFHGGHGGGGGGFHGGGSHHSSYHSHSSYHGGTRVYVNAPVHTHRVIDGKHYIDGKRYYGPYYGQSNGKPKTFASVLMTGIVVAFIGLILFLVFFCRTTRATITRVDTAHDYTGYYYVYDFDYEVNGKTYSGYGDDDDPYTVGETYAIYYNTVDHSKYSFKNTNPLAFILGGTLMAIGAAIIITTVNTRRKHQKLLEEVGDANGDGVVNDLDIEYAEKKAQGQADGAYSGMRDQTYENTRYEARKDIKCPYCDSLLDVNDKFCQNCGAALGNK